MLRDAGFGVLALDLRGHGASGGGGNAFGWEGTRDVQAAVAYLQGDEGVRAIGGLGLSLGGEVLLGALNATPALGPVASEGATYRSTAEYLALPWTRRPCPAADTAPGLRRYWPLHGRRPARPDCRLDCGRAGRAPPPDCLGEGADEVAYNTRFAAVAGDRAQLWVVPDVEHTGALAGHPDEYGRRVSTFLRNALIARGLSGS